MNAFIDVVGYLSLVAFTGLGVAALRQWFVRRDRASLWAVLAFGALAVVVLAGRVLPDDPDTQLELRATSVTSPCSSSSRISSTASCARSAPAPAGRTRSSPS